jgi:alkanesulfonate monooxygenase SsuD/methylene tetrahydromethanopterin reductase-like flavin-dependent oxidoreductase (luciferase family)
VASSAEDKQAALDRRLQGRLRQLDIARKPGGEVDQGWRFKSSYADNVAVNEASAIYGSPDEMIEKLETLRAMGAGYVLLNGGGSGGGERARESLRRFAREVMPAMQDKPALKVAG